MFCTELSSDIFNTAFKNALGSCGCDCVLCPFSERQKKNHLLTAKRLNFACNSFFNVIVEAVFVSFFFFYRVNVDKT